MKSIGDGAFDGCTGLKELHIAQANPERIEIILNEGSVGYFKGIEHCTLYVPAGSEKAFRKEACFAVFAEVKGE